MNTLKNTKCYTIGPLEKGDWSHATQWRQELKTALEPMGIQVISPLDKVFTTFSQETQDFHSLLKEKQKNGDWQFVHEEMKKIRNRDLAITDYSTFVVAVLPEGVSTTGGIDELLTALRLRRFVYLVVPQKGFGGLPLWLCSYFKPESVYKTLEDAIEDIKKINQTPPDKLDNKYWKIWE